MERLSLLDAEFLHLEDPASPMHIASISVMEGPFPSKTEIERLFRAKLHLMPRCRQRVRFVPFELGRPVWADDPDFRIDYHVRLTALPAPGDDAALCSLVGRLMSQPLDRTRPLWEAWFVSGLENDRWALVLKTHHCMVDGIAGVGLMTALLDHQKDTLLGEPEPWSPREEPPGIAKILDAWEGVAKDARVWAGKAQRRLQAPRGAAEFLLGTSTGLFTFARQLLPTPALSIGGWIGAHRSYARTSVSLMDVQLIRKQFGGTMNDVVLYAISSGYRALLKQRAEDIDSVPVRALVPVSVRAPEECAGASNSVSGILVDLPVALSDPRARLAAAHARMSALKKSHMAEAGAWLTEIGNLAPPMIVGTITRLAARVMHKLPQRSINTVVTNVPGPRFPLYCMGRKILEIFPFVPITQGLRTATAVLTYEGSLHFGITADYDTAGDIEAFVGGIRAAVAELANLARSESSSPSRAFTPTCGDGLSRGVQG